MLSSAKLWWTLICRRNNEGDSRHHLGTPTLIACVEDKIPHRFYIQWQSCWSILYLGTSRMIKKNAEIGSKKKKFWNEYLKILYFVRCVLIKYDSDWMTEDYNHKLLLITHYRLEGFIISFGHRNFSINETHSVY